MQRNISDILEDQKAYYRKRAGEYDEWFLRRGRYDRGAENNAAWFSETESAKASLLSQKPFGDVLEIAGGTGNWTKVLKDQADFVHVLDSSPEVLEINKSKNGEVNVTYEVADIFSWSPPRQYDFVFFGFWLSHVPEEKFELFWDLVKRSLKPDGRWFLIDSRPDEASRAVDHPPEGKDTAIRKLNDGSAFEIVKRFYDVQELGKSLNALGWRSELAATDRFFLYGCGGTLRP